MSRVDPRQRVMPSLLDRLIDPDSAGTSGARGHDVQRLVDSVRRDLEELLNTRQSHQGLPEDFVELHASVLTYGLPDFSSIKAEETGDVREMGQMIEAIVARFEPRLRDIRAVPVESDDGQGRHVRFHIDARLRVDPYPEVAFETVVELLSGHTSIESRDA